VHRRSTPPRRGPRAREVTLPPPSRWRKRPGQHEQSQREADKRLNGVGSDQSDNERACRSERILADVADGSDGRQMGEHPQVRWRHIVEHVVPARAFPVCRIDQVEAAFQGLTFGHRQRISPTDLYRRAGCRDQPHQDEDDDDCEHGTHEPDEPSGRRPRG
jgi:hypothetical protein